MNIPGCFKLFSPLFGFLDIRTLNAALSIDESMSITLVLLEEWVVVMYVTTYLPWGCLTLPTS